MWYGVRSLQLLVLLCKLLLVQPGEAQSSSCLLLDLSSRFRWETQNLNAVKYTRLQIRVMDMDSYDYDTGDGPRL